MIKHAGILAIVFAAGCGVEPAYTPGSTPTDSDLLPGFTLPDAPAPDVGMRFITPPTLGLEAGSSHEICAWTGIKVDHTIDIRKVIGYQAIAGHHIILFASKVNKPAGTMAECTDADMASFRQIAAAGMEGIPSEAPGDLVYRIDPDYYLVLQEHYINETDAPIDSQSVLDVIFATPGGNYTPSHSIAFLNTDLNLPPGQSSIDVHCTMQHDLVGWYAIPHMHEWGSSFTGSITHVGTGVKEMIWDKMPWNKEYMFSPPQAPGVSFTQTKTLDVGDQVDVHCEWDNTTPDVLHFGTEMCVFYLQTIDAEGIGNVDCDNGDWGSF